MNEKQFLQGSFYVLCAAIILLTLQLTTYRFLLGYVSIVSFTVAGAFFLLAEKERQS